MFTLFGQPTSLLEIAAFVTGLASVWLVRGMHIANWPVGLVNVLCFAWLFLEAKLYADASLQIAFFVLGIYGWWVWATQGAAASELPVSTLSGREMGIWAAACVASTVACAQLLQWGTDSPAPWADAALTSLSLVATWGQARRKLESWWLWIGVDLIAIPLYWSRSLALTAVLYFMFLLICIAGLVAWRGRLASHLVASA